MDSREFADDVNFMNIIEESSSISSNSKIKRTRELAKYSPDVGSVKSFYKQQRTVTLIQLNQLNESQPESAVKFCF